jgi:hypothetical protein
VGKLKLMLERLLRVKAGQQALLLVPPPEASSSSGGGSSGGVQVGGGARHRHCSVHPAPSPACMHAPPFPASPGPFLLISRILLCLPCLPSLQPEDITDDDARELRYYDVCDGCR